MRVGRIQRQSRKREREGKCVTDIEIDDAEDEGEKEAPQASNKSEDDQGLGKWKGQEQNLSGHFAAFPRHLNPVLFFFPEPFETINLFSIRCSSCSSCTVNVTLDTRFEWQGFKNCCFSSPLLLLNHSDSLYVCGIRNRQD